MKLGSLFNPIPSASAALNELKHFRENVDGPSEIPPTPLKTAPNLHQVSIPTPSTALHLASALISQKTHHTSVFSCLFIHGTRFARGNCGPLQDPELSTNFYYDTRLLILHAKQFLIGVHRAS